MKFQKLTIHNIASIEDATIDFEAEPLANSEVFLITGKTGAGKSTILDAICLALYADTPRLDNTKMQGDTKDGEQEVKVNDPRQLMRRHTGEAFVSLTFTGSNRVHYEAVWSIARARKKATGNMQKKEWQLKNLDTGYTFSKDKEIEAEIKAAIGLDFNQFCRTTLLAQGEFTRFLNSKDDEKAEILEKITGVDSYSKIGKKIFIITNQKEQSWKEAQRLTEGTRTLTETEILEKEEALDTLNQRYHSLKIRKEQEQGKHDWIQLIQERTIGVEKAKKAYQLALEVLASEKFKQQETLIQEWHITRDARREMIELQEAQKSEEQQQANLEKLAEKYTEIISGQKFTEQEIEKCNAEIEAIHSFLLQESDKVVVYEKEQTIVSQLNTIATGRKIIAQNQEVIVRENHLLRKELHPTYLQIQKQAMQAKAVLEQEEVAVKEQEEAISALNLPALRLQRDSHKDRLTAIATAEERIENFVEAQRKIESMRQAHAERLMLLEAKKKSTIAMEGAIHDAKLKLDIHKENFDKQSDTIHKFAATLRLKLQVGETCPVCLQKITSQLPQEEELSELVTELKKDYEQAEKEHLQWVNKKVKLDAEITTESQAYERDLQALQKDQSIATAKQKAQEACKTCGIEHLDTTTASALGRLKRSTQTTMAELDANIAAGEIQEKKVQKLRKALDAKRKMVESLRAIVQEKENAINECKRRIATAEALLRLKSQEVETTEQQVALLLSSGSWEVVWREAPEEFAAVLTSATQTYHQQLQKKQQLTSYLETAQTQLEQVNHTLISLYTLLPAWKEIFPVAVAKIDQLPTKITELYSSVKTVHTQLKAAEEAKAAHQAQLDRFIDEHPQLNLDRLQTLNAYSLQDIERKNDSLKQKRDTAIAQKTLLEKAEELLHEHQQKKPELQEGESLELLVELIATIEKEQHEIGEQKGAILQELKTDRENKERWGILKEEADKKKKEYQKWSRLNQLIGDATGNKFRKIAQSYILANLIHSANSYLKSLTDRYTLKVTPGTFVISLEDAYQGFASRAASTISGGESFLVSLSLALALSDIGQNLSVDTLFIDEGFGTLSGEPLQNAIHTLRTLHTQAGRHVGIISHVEELQERIPVQIQVLQEGNKSSSQVRIVPEIKTP